MNKASVIKEEKYTDKISALEEEILQIKSDPEHLKVSKEVLEDYKEIREENRSLKRELEDLRIKSDEIIKDLKKQLENVEEERTEMKNSIDKEQKKIEEESTLDFIADNFLKELRSLGIMLNRTDIDDNIILEGRDGCIIRIDVKDRMLY